MMVIDLDVMKAELASDRLGMPGFDVNRAIELISEIERLRAELAALEERCKQFETAAADALTEADMWRALAGLEYSDL